VTLTYLRRHIVLKYDLEESQNSWIWSPYNGDNEEFYLMEYNDFQLTTQRHIPEDRTPLRIVGIQVKIRNERIGVVIQR
jgi:hypothetical protein